MIETWKDVVGYEGLYKVSNLGNVLRTANNKLLKHELTPLSYHRVTLYKDGVPKHHSVHKLVALAFIPNPSNYPCINHKDENPSNNCCDNLEWCTYSYNVNYGTRNLKISAKSKPVKQMTFEGFVLATYYSAQFAANVLGVDSSNIYKCLRGEISYAYDCKWEYA